MTSLSDPKNAHWRALLELGALVFKFGIRAVVAWGAVSGGTFGLGCAIFFVLGYLQTMKDSLEKLQELAITSSKTSA
jgi:hypothetical protein